MVFVLRLSSGKEPDKTIVRLTGEEVDMQKSFCSVFVNTPFTCFFYAYCVMLLLWSFFHSFCNFPGLCVKG